MNMGTRRQEHHLCRSQVTRVILTAQLMRLVREFIFPHQINRDI